MISELSPLLATITGPFSRPPRRISTSIYLNSPQSCTERQKDETKLSQYRLTTNCKLYSYLSLPYPIPHLPVDNDNTIDVVEEEKQTIPVIWLRRLRANGAYRATVTEGGRANHKTEIANPQDILALLALSNDP